MGQPELEETLSSDIPNRNKLGEMLATRSWIGFDLDDTLHEFRRASSTAITRTLQAISTQYGTPVDDLKAYYSTVLRQKTASAFSEGKTSHQYREERFRALSDQFSLDVDGTYMAQLLKLYETTLIGSLELKNGVPELFSTIHALGKKIAVITEGPQDAQERTVKALGLAEHIDFLATTNKFGLSKVDGLLAKVLDHLEIAPRDMAFVGDSEERDMKPAVEAGIFCIHFSPGADVTFESKIPRVGNMYELKELLLSNQ